MLMVVLGAGASYDSVQVADVRENPPPHESWQPPLAAGLFDSRANYGLLLNQYDLAIPLVAQLRPLARTEGVLLERELERFRDEAQSDPRRNGQLAALQFYLHDLISNCGSQWLQKHFRVTNYAALLDRLEHWRQVNDEQVLWVTFNYDTLIESAAQVCLPGWTLNNMDSYVSDASFRLVKLHGSVSWARFVETVLPQGSGGPQRIIQLATNGALRLSQEIVDRTSFGSQRPLYPALAIPVEKKHTFECPQSHLNVLVEAIPKVSRMLTIGWRGQEQHFLKLLSEGGLAEDVRAYVVSGGQDHAQETVRNIGEGGVHLSDPFASGQSFSQLIGSDQLERFLTSDDSLNE